MKADPMRKRRLSGAGACHRRSPAAGVLVAAALAAALLSAPALGAAATESPAGSGEAIKVYRPLPGTAPPRLTAPAKPVPVIDTKAVAPAPKAAAQPAPTPKAEPAPKPVSLAASPKPAADTPTPKAADATPGKKAEEPKPGEAAQPKKAAPKPKAAGKEKPTSKAAEKDSPKDKPKTAADAPAGAAGKKPAPPSDGLAYPISKFVLSYGREHPDHPPIEQFLSIPIELGKTAKGYVAPRAGLATETIQLRDFMGGKPETFFATAIRRINEQVVAAFNEAGLVGIFVAPDQKDVNAKTGKDLREAGNTTLRLVVWSAVVSRVRTLAAGERIAESERIDNPAHSRILENSPLRPKDLLRKDKLDDYVFFLSRHPGRRADAAVTSGEKSGEVALDYLVSENKPWLAYAQTSNTGTEATDKWRYRFGVIHNQLTGNDDILSLEYVASCLEREPEAQSAIGSYEAPFLDIDKLRWRVYGSWADYEADVKTGGLFGQNYTGYEWRIGGEMSWNFYQHRQTFLDAIAGVAWWRIHTDNETLNIVGDADCFLNYVGLKMERITDVATSLGTVMVEWNCPGVAGSDEDDLALLGRDPVDGDWVLLKWDLLQSFFLEPLLDREAWMDTSSGEEAWKSSTLAHEMAFHFRGQYAMSGYRLIPQNERVVGGLYTVRGYPESATAGDTALIGTAEYRLHVPRLFKPEGDPGKTPLPIVGTPFRWAPQTIFGRPDWDLIVRAFFDIGRASNVDRLQFEEDFTLIGTGVGVEVQFTSNLNVRVDWGVALRDMDSTSQTVEAGDNRVRLVATVLY